MTIRVKKPYDRVLDDAILKGVVELPAAPDGLYLRRLEKELAGSFIIRPKERDVFECIRGEDAVEKIGENSRHAHYRKRKRRWI